MRNTRRVVLLVVLCLFIFSTCLQTNAAGTSVKSKLDEIMTRYPSGSTWTKSFAGASQCLGFAYLVVNELFGNSNISGYTWRRWEYDGDSTSGMNVVGRITNYSADNMKTLMSKAKCGDVLQFDVSKQHSMIVYSVESNGIYVYDCNGTGNYCEVKLRFCSYGNWNGRSSNRLTLLRANNYPDDGNLSDNVEVLPTYASESNTIKSNDARVHGTVNKASSAAVQKLGIRIAKQGSDYSTGKTYKYTPQSGNYVGVTTVHPWFDIKDEVGYTLTHATTYKYQIYAQVNGKDYWSAEKTFTTTGSHSYGSWTTVSSATCTAAGSQKRTCSCGAVETKTVAATGHSYSSSYTVDKEPTCTVAGSKSKHCTKCSAKTGVTAIAATGRHSYGSWTTVSSATCTAAGSQKRTCSCGYAETKAVAALGHQSAGQWQTETAPTCTETGFKVQKCSNCNTVTARQSIAATGHDFGAWKVETQATTAKDGKEIRICSNSGCGKAETRTIPKLPEEGHVHSFGQWTQSVAATCTAEGIQVSVCSGCGAQQTMTVAAVGHQYQTQEVTNPDGSKQINFACANCSDVIVSEILPPAPGEEITPTETAESLPEESSAENTEATAAGDTQEDKPAKNNGIVIAIAAGAILAAVGAGTGTFFALRKRKK